ncbi:hypothetical protein H483_0104005 [Dietzia sp. UCD-THP]|nr:hypothetical protein H483_0104005 [Dietzia sp. UCD-THP]
MADHVPPHGPRQVRFGRRQVGHLRGRLLHPVLPQVAHPQAGESCDVADRVELGDDDEVDAVLTARRRQRRVQSLPGLGEPGGQFLGPGIRHGCRTPDWRFAACP